MFGGKVRVNGKWIPLEQSIDLIQFLKRHGFSTDKIAVEKNGEIVCKADFEKTILTDEDILEIVQFVGGG